MVKASDNVYPRFLISEGGSTATPAAGRVTVYAKADGLVYSKDDAGTEKLMSSGTSTAVGNMWKMSKTSSQTLTNGATDTITFDATDIDGGSSVVDLANDRFVAPATGFYLAFATWLWETTVPSSSANMTARVGGADVASLARLQIVNTGGAANGGATGNWSLSLTSGDFVTLCISPSTVTGVTARGNASTHLRTSFTLVRIT